MKHSALKLSLVGALLAFGVFAADDSRTKDMNKGKKDASFVEDAANASLTEVKMSQLALTMSSNASVKEVAQQMIDDHTKAFESLKAMATSKGFVLPFESIGSRSTTGTAIDQPAGTDVNGSGNAGEGISGSGERMGTGDRVGTGDRGATGDRVGTGDRMGIKADDIPASLPKASQKKYDELSKLNGEKFDKTYLGNLIDDHKKVIKFFEKESKSGDDSEFKTWATNTLPTLRHHLEMAQSTEKDLKKSSM